MDVKSESLAFELSWNTVARDCLSDKVLSGVDLQHRLVLGFRIRKSLSTLVHVV